MAALGAEPQRLEIIGRAQAYEAGRQLQQHQAAGRRRAQARPDLDGRLVAANGDRHDALSHASLLTRSRGQLPRPSDGPRVIRNT